MRNVYEDLHKGEEAYNDEDMSSCTDHGNTDSSQIDTIPEFTTNEIQVAIDRLKKGKAKDGTGVRPEQLKNCSDDTNEKIRTIFNEIVQQEDFTPKKLANDPYPSHVQKRQVTERIQAITGQYVAYQSFTSCLPQFCMPGLHLLCTKYSIQTREAAGPTIDVKITLRCTES